MNHHRIAMSEHSKLPCNVLHFIYWILVKLPANVYDQFGELDLDMKKIRSEKLKKSE